MSIERAEWALLYGLGYYQGREVGEGECPEWACDTGRHYWRAGYDKGVADYSATLDDDDDA